MKKTKWYILLMIIVVMVIVAAIFFLIFNKNMSKVSKNGNNMSSQEIVNQILEISSYKANVTVEINSNKNSNKYVLSQEYIHPNTNMQEVIEPSNISGIKIIRDGDALRIENTKLDLSKIFENYNYLADNCLDLSVFINDYKQYDKSTCEETNEQIVMKTESLNGNKYTKNKVLYIDKQTIKPVRLEIKDNNQNTTVNILYNKVEISNSNE